jgi:hypothetical protein
MSPPRASNFPEMATTCSPLAPSSLMKGQFVITRAFGIRFGLAFDKAELRFAREHVGGQLADEQQNDAGVRELDADFSDRQLKAIEVRGDEVEQQRVPMR